MTRLLLEGETVQVWGPEDAADPGAGPRGFVWRGELYHVEEVCNRWQVHTRWWEAGETVWRAYWKVTTGAPRGAGMLCELVHDRLAGEWFLSRVYD